jgi:hypothetical protein
MDITKMHRRRSTCIAELAALPGWIGGSLIQTRRIQAGTAKPFRYLSRSVKGKNRITYVAADEMPAFRTALKTGQRASILFAEVCELTVAILKAESKRTKGGTP